MFEPKRKNLRRIHEPGHIHELTFSCYQRQPLLVKDGWRKELCTSIDRALNRWQVRLSAFVIMPNHVHLLVYPEDPAVDFKTVLPDFLSAIKRPFSYRIKQRLMIEDLALLAKLTIRERPNKETFRFWLEGAGYDRNFERKSSILHSIHYIHLNPVRRGLVERPEHWKWSSARWYLHDKLVQDPDLPAIHGVPW